MYYCASKNLSQVIANAKANPYPKVSSRIVQSQVRTRNQAIKDMKSPPSIGVITRLMPGSVELRANAFGKIRRLMKPKTRPTPKYKIAVRTTRPVFRIHGMRPSSCTASSARNSATSGTTSSTRISTRIDMVYRKNSRKASQKTKIFFCAFCASLWLNNGK